MEGVATETHLSPPPSSYLPFPPPSSFLPSSLSSSLPSPSPFLLLPPFSLSSSLPSPLPFLLPPLSHSHSNQNGLTGARKLCESLIDAVQKEFENWNKSQQPLGFGGTAPGYGPRESATCLSVCLSVCLSATCLSVYLPVCVSVCLSVSVRRFKKAPRFAVLLVLLLASDIN